MNIIAVILACRGSDGVTYRKQRDSGQAGMTKFEYLIVGLIVIEPAFCCNYSCNIYSNLLLLKLKPY